MEIGKDVLNFFKRRWEAYMRSCEMSDIDDIRIQLVNCCEDDLEQDVSRSLGSNIDSASEGYNGGDGDGAGAE